MSKHKQHIGKKGEQIAKKHFENKQYKILNENWRNSNQEVDLIVFKNETLVFVEVKTRTSKEFGNPENAVTDKKQKQIIKAAEAYIQTAEIEFKRLRFDVVS